ncbi:hypothetical protein LTR85_003792 [Meristemomyces frigidus]|nr:hypothetical protein LTR85_003792 [Meristemomyces frigidus]
MRDKTKESSRDDKINEDYNTSNNDNNDLSSHSASDSEAPRERPEVIDLTADSNAVNLLDAVDRLDGAESQVESETADQAAARAEYNKLYPFFTPYDGSSAAAVKLLPRKEPLIDLGAGRRWKFVEWLSSGSGESLAFDLEQWKVDHPDEDLLA